jgi:hypothetical protein
MYGSGCAQRRAGSSAAGARRPARVTDRPPGDAHGALGAPCSAPGSLCFLIGPFPGLLVGPGGDTATFFVGSLPSPPVRGCRRGWRAGRPSGGPRSSSSRAHCFQRDNVPRAGHGAPKPRVRRARVAAGRVRLSVLPRLRGDRVPRRHATACVAGGQPARLSVLRNRRRGRLRRSRDRLDARPGRRQLEHSGGRAVFRGMRACRAQKGDHASRVASTAPATVP